MRTFSRIGFVSAATFVGLVAQPLHSQPPSTPHAIKAAADGHAFSIKDAKGHFIALHFMAQPETPECTAFIREYLSAAPGLAGLRHIFIRTDTAANAKTWSTQFNDGAGSLFIDADGALSRDFNITAPFATVVLDTEGNELFRHAGATQDDHLSWNAFASQFETKTKRPTLADYNLPRNKPLAVEGYDLVAYFKANKALKGKADLVSKYRGVIYQFATEENRRLFAADPERYLPTYGGWCASAMGAKGTKVEIDPTNFKIKDGRLFLFYKSTFGDALKDWNKHEREWEPAADSNWKNLTREEPYFPPAETSPR